MPRLYAQTASNWIAANWNTAADGSGSALAPTSSDTADVNGLAVTWVFGVDGSIFGNAASIVDGVGGGTFTLKVGDIVLNQNLLLDVSDDGSGTNWILNNLSSGVTLTISSSVTTSSGVTFTTAGTVNNSGTINGVTFSASGGTFNELALGGGVGAVTFSGSGGTFNRAATASDAASITFSGSGGVYNDGDSSAAVVTFSGSGGTYNPSSGTQTGSVAFTGATNSVFALTGSATYNGSGSPITVTGSGCLMTVASTATCGANIVVNGGAVVFDGTFAGTTITMTTGLLVSSVDLSSAIAFATVSLGATLLITGGIWTLSATNNGQVLDATTGSGITVASGNPIVKLRPAGKVKAGETYGVSGFGPDGNAGLLTGTLASSAALFLL